MIKAGSIRINPWLEKYKIQKKKIFEIAIIKNAHIARMV